MQEFTAAEIENAQRGVESLRLSVCLRPASAVNAPDPEAVRTRKEQLALAAERAAERDAQALVAPAGDRSARPRTPRRRKMRTT